MSLTFSAVFGLMPGYGEFTYVPHHHDAPIAKAVSDAIASVHAVSGIVVGCVVTPGRVFYPRQFGCPDNGETIITVSGAHNPVFCGADEWREAATSVVELIKEALQQQRVTLTFSTNDAVLYLETKSARAETLDRLAESGQRLAPDDY